MPVDRDTTEARRLEQALSTGPFSLALRLALRASGLSLDRVQVRLRERDAAVSKTALSNWQSGRTQPERAESLRALTELEHILGVRPGALSRLLGPPRPRGRWLTQTPGDIRADQAWARPDGLARALERMGTGLEAINRLAVVSIQVTSTLSADRVVRTMRYRLVLRANTDGVDRHTAAYRTDTGGTCAVTDTYGCRLGRSRQDTETGFTTFELLLDHPVDAGELVSVEYVLRVDAPESYHSQRVRLATQLYDVQIRFDPTALPVRVYRTYQASIGDPAREQTELALGASFTAHHATVDPTPGIYRIYWDWE